MWQTRRMHTDYDLLAPDGSQIRLLARLPGGSMVYCTLPAGRTTRAVRHRTVEELWLCVAGRGQVWRRSAEREEVTNVEPGVALTIPLGVSFQFRTVGAAPLELVIATLPPWPGEDEAVAVDESRWEVVA
jgi:mannose-6-phosphate isomerase-like protein (cupin superfamily)